jgi:hypothetical protein
VSGTVKATTPGGARALTRKQRPFVAAPEARMSTVLFDRWHVAHGAAEEVLPTLESGGVGAVITDPPSG